MPFAEAQISQPAASEAMEITPDSIPYLRGFVWDLSRDARGCRQVQDAFEVAVSDDQRIDLASELHSHVWEAMKCQNANHVLQKCISTMRPSASQFIIDEIMHGGANAVGRVARHRYSCRILQRLLEHCSSEQMSGLVENLLDDAVPLATHIYANYVMQHLLEYGTEKQVHRLTQLLADHASMVGENMFGCGVLHKAFEHADQEAQVVLADAILGQAHLVMAMACSRHGNAAVKLALQVASIPQRQAALQELMAHEEVLKASRYGRALYKGLDLPNSFL
jgi:pumilio RNA-binding family